MIRKIIIVVLTLGAVGTFALKIDSLRARNYVNRPGWKFEIGAQRIEIYRTGR